MHWPPMPRCSPRPGRRSRSGRSIYLGLAGYTIWQWLPSATADPRARATGGLFAVSMVLNAMWLLVTQQGWLWASVAVIVALLATLVRAGAAAALRCPPAPRVVQRLVLDATAGLYLGWVAVATCANVAATLVADGVEPGPASRPVGRGARPGGGRGGRSALGPGAERPRRCCNWPSRQRMAWGLGWIAVGRLTDAPTSVITAGRSPGGRRGHRRCRGRCGALVRLLERPPGDVPGPAGLASRRRAACVDRPRRPGRPRLDR